MVATAAFLAAVAIGLGAFGAHGLKNLVPAEAVLSFQTGVRYQMYHALAILFLGIAPVISVKMKWAVFWPFALGTVFFSGSIYLLALNSLLGADVSFLGPLTPLGGLLFIVGWLQLARAVLKRKR